jgi:replicative DNA helicase
MNDIWLRGVEDKYPKELLEGRINAEASVIGILWKDPLILDEVSLSSTDFLSKDGRFYFGIERQLRAKNLNEFDEVAVISNLSEETLEQFNERGGYKAIDNIATIVSLKNRDSILDELYKYNTILKLHDSGFNLTKKIQIGKREMAPLDFFKSLTSVEVVEWYEAQLNKMYAGGYDVKLLEDVDIEITDEFLESLANAEEYGTPYAYAGEDINGDTMNVFPYLSSLTLGFTRQASHYIAGFSSSGKTAMWCSIAMAMAKEEKILIICNEQSSKVWKINMILFILYKHFKEYGITKSNLMAGKLTDENKAMLQKAKKYFNDNYKGRMHFIQLSENSFDVVKAKIRFYALQYGYSMVIFDTLKISDSNKRDSNVAAWEELVQYSRDLDILAKKLNLIMCASVQLTQSQKGSLFLDSNMLSGAKGMVEQLDTLLCLRDVYKEELDPMSKYFCHPYQMKKDNDGNVVAQDYLCDPKYAWKFCFLAKSRNSENSNSSGSALMFKFNGRYATFSECCWGKPKHGFIGTN